MKCDIIIPIWNQLEFTKDCIGHIIKNTLYPYRLILIDNASDAPTKQYLEGLKRDSAQEVTLIRNESNLGFVKAVNQGLKISSSPYVCIMNNDTVPAPGWLERMVEFAESHADVGLINPQCSGHGNMPIDFYARSLARYKDKYMEMNQCQGWCMVVKREVVDRIGYLDESFGIGGFDDTDYSMRAGLSGYRCVNLHSAYVYHREHATFNAMGDRKTLVSKGEEEYFKKWPRHLRMGLIFSLDGRKDDAEIKNLLDTVLFLARDWCWINLWIFGDAESNRKKISMVSERIGMPLHQNVKMNFFSSRFKDIHILTKVIERSFGTKKRKRYDLVLSDDENTARLLNLFSPLCRTSAHAVTFKGNVIPGLKNMLKEIRGRR